MTLLLAQWLVTIFSVISLVHVYWALGGEWAAVAVVPQVPQEGSAQLRPAFKPRGWITLVVAAALLSVVLSSWWVFTFVPALIDGTLP